MTPLQSEILAELGSRPCGRENTWIARCPVSEQHANGDHNPSLSILMGDDGWLHPNCHKGCHRDKVRASLGRPVSDWGPSGPESHPVRRQPVKVVACYPYLDACGRLAYEVVRTEPKSFRRRRPHPEAKGEWVWGTDPGLYVRTKPKCWLSANVAKTAPKEAPRVELLGVPLIPYRLTEWIGCPRGTPIVIVEGEKDVDTLRSLGIMATTLPGGATDEDWRRLAILLRDRQVIIVPDNDGAGQKRANQCLAACVRQKVAGVRIFDWNHDSPGYDISDLVLELADNHGWPVQDKAILDDIHDRVMSFLFESPCYSLSA
jgi:putative DNA primase/helicase